MKVQGHDVLPRTDQGVRRTFAGPDEEEASPSSKGSLLSCLSIAYYTITYYNTNVYYENIHTLIVRTCLFSSRLSKCLIHIILDPHLGITSFPFWLTSTDSGLQAQFVIRCNE